LLREKTLKGCGWLVGWVNRGEGEGDGVARKWEKVTGKVGRETKRLPAQVGLHRKKVTKMRENGAFGL
jgi:hypothetical protein